VKCYRFRFPTDFSTLCWQWSLTDGSRTATTMEEQECRRGNSNHGHRRGVLTTNTFSLEAIATVLFEGVQGPAPYPLPRPRTTAAEGRHSNLRQAATRQGRNALARKNAKSIGTRCPGSPTTQSLKPLPPRTRKSKRRHRDHRRQNRQLSQCPRGKAAAASQTKSRWNRAGSASR
jgi:hypothetical protein